jgi:murein DD-endopeptidase MepM/ murein hydrolase activator NlpD
MRAVVESRSRRALARAVLLFGVGLGSAGCSTDTTRFGESPFGSPYASRGPASTEVTGSVAQPAPVGTVDAQPLPAPPAAGRPGSVAGVSGAGVSGGGRGMASYQPGTAGQDITGAVPRLHAAAKPPAPAWHWEGGTPVTVAPGETLATLSQRYGVPASAIAQANGLPSPAALQPGQRLVIPRFNAAAAPGRTVQGPTPASNQRAPLSSIHIVAPGETLVGIAKRYGKPITEVAAANKIPPHTMVKMGDRIIIPGKSTVTAAPKLAPGAPQTVAPRAEAPAPAAPAAPQKVAAIEPAATARVATPDVPEEERSATGQAPAFRWPVRGRVITTFGSKTSGQQNDGINLAVPEGTAVRAAEDGVVAYAGNELKGYGNLILVRHANGFVTAYAHASEIMVKRNDQVRRGQVIAKSGQTGTVTTPQLHFEIRKGATPVDPMQYLAAL